MKKILTILLLSVASAWSQTPSQPLPEIEHLSGTNYAITWEGLSNRVYFMQISSEVTSEDKLNWEFVPDIRIGEGNLLSMGFTKEADGKQFFRLVYIDQGASENPYFLDYDNDGFTNLEEITVNADPFDNGDTPISYNSGGLNGSGFNYGVNGSGAEPSKTWEYSIQYTYGSHQNGLNFYEGVSRIPYDYGRGENIHTNITFTNVKGENSISFIKTYPNGDYDPSVQGSPEISLAGVLTLSSDNYEFDYTAPTPTKWAGNFLPVEFSTDINNDGKINPFDSNLIEKSFKTGATSDDVSRGTEYMFNNDDLSNGLWDKEDPDPDKPANEDDDDDVEKIIIKPGITQGEVWLDHPAISGLSFYKTKECKAADEINLSPQSHFLVSPQNPLPSPLYIRTNSQISFPNGSLHLEGDLVLKVQVGAGQHKQTLEVSKIKFTIVKELGSQKYFQAVRDYILEKNIKFYVDRKTYLSDVIKMVFMLEEQTLMFPIDAARRPGGTDQRGIDAVVAGNPGTVMINGNQCFFIDGRSKFLATAAGDITDRCHGRVVRMRRLDLDTSSDQHLPEHSGGGRHWSSGPDYSPLAGAEPMPDGSRGGNYFSQIKHGQFEMAASVLPSSQTDPKLNPMSGMGGLSANAQRREAAGAAIQAIGHYKDPVTQAGIVFSASTEVGSGRGLSLSNDAAASGVEALPGGRVGEIKLLFLDGSSSVALAYEKKGLGVKTDIKFSKHNNFGTYYISTYLIFNSTPPRR